MPKHNTLEELQFSYVMYTDYLLHGPLEEVRKHVPILNEFNGDLESREDVVGFLLKSIDPSQRGDLEGFVETYEKVNRAMFSEWLRKQL